VAALQLMWHVYSREEQQEAMEKIAAAAEARKQQGSGGMVGGAVGLVGDAAGAGVKVSHPHAPHTMATQWARGCRGRSPPAGPRQGMSS
jgi:hypothetical protein